MDSPLPEPLHPEVASTSGWLGCGPAARRIRRLIASAALLDAHVLITGETGTGKGVAARELHARSPRRARPFVRADLASLVPGLLESELFGHERGAFTGAAVAHAGRCELAADGVLFLDEIGELERASQARLLGVLDEGVFARVGSSRPRRLRARVVAATQVDLEEAVERGRFRADLLHRLDVLRIALPPLRERPEDLPDLIAHGLQRAARRCGVPVRHMSDPLAERLAARSWPGNVRELFHLLERLTAVAEERTLREADLERAEAGRPGRLAAHRAFVDGEDPGARARGTGLEAALRAAGFNVSRAARRLGVPRTTLRRRIRAAGLEALIPRD